MVARERPRAYVETTMKYALLFACLFIAASSAIVASESPIRVYVFTTPPARPAFPTPDDRDRRDSVKDMIWEINRWFEFDVVNDRGEAEIMVEILGREIDPRNADRMVVHCRVTSGGDVMIVDGLEERWLAAAQDAAGQIRRWAKSHKAEIVARRPLKKMKEKYSPCTH